MEITKTTRNTKQQMSRKTKRGVSVKHGVRLQSVKEFLRELKRGRGGLGGMEENEVMIQMGNIDPTLVSWGGSIERGGEKVRGEWKI